MLEDRITYVATKVVHLGDQLETLNSCMLRDLEAQDVMKHVAEFEQKAKPTVGVFTDPSRVRGVRRMELSPGCLVEASVMRNGCACADKLLWRVYSVPDLWEGGGAFMGMRL